MLHTLVLSLLMSSVVHASKRCGPRLDQSPLLLKSREVISLVKLVPPNQLLRRAISDQSSVISDQPLMTDLTVDFGGLRAVAAFESGEVVLFEDGADPRLLFRKPGQAEPYFSYIVRPAATPKFLGQHGLAYYEATHHYLDGSNPEEVLNFDLRLPPKFVSPVRTFVDSELFATTPDRNQIFYLTEYGRRLNSKDLDGHASVKALRKDEVQFRALSVSPSGRRVAALGGDVDGRVYVGAVSASRLTEVALPAFVGHALRRGSLRAGPTMFQFRDDHTLILGTPVTPGESQRLFVFDLRLKSVLHRHVFDSDLRVQAVSSGGRYAVVSPRNEPPGGVLAIYNIEGEEPRLVYQTQHRYLGPLAFNDATLSLWAQTPEGQLERLLFE